MPVKAYIEKKKDLESLMKSVQRKADLESVEISSKEGRS